MSCARCGSVACKVPGDSVCLQDRKEYGGSLRDVYEGVGTDFTLVVENGQVAVVPGNRKPAQ